MPGSLVVGSGCICECCWVLLSVVDWFALVLLNILATNSRRLLFNVAMSVALSFLKKTIVILNGMYFKINKH